MKKETRLSIRIDSELKECLQARASEKNRTISNYVLDLVKRDLNSTQPMYYAETLDKRAKRFLVLGSNGQLVKATDSTEDIQGLQRVIKKGSHESYMYNDSQCVSVGPNFIPGERIDGAAEAIAKNLS